MTTEAVSIPIAPASDCCSDSSTAAGGLPVVSGHGPAESCCSETSAIPQPVSVSESATTPSHGESCSHSISAAADIPAAETTTADDSVAPDDAALIDALRQVIDPELMINIVDLGLVYSINHTDRKVLVEMTLTSPACPAGPQIISQAKMSLEKLPGVETAEIKLTMSPPWTPDRMTDDARDQLGIF